MTLPILLVMVFMLDSRIEASTLAFGRLALCRVRIMNDKRFPWLVLVPERAGLREIHDLSADQRNLLVQETAEASRALQTVCAVHKINVGALGNIVPQLHVHVVGRLEGDPAWPGPVWGFGTPIPYEGTEADDFAVRLKGVFCVF